MSDHSIPPTEPNLSELKKVRLEKLKELQEQGLTPLEVGLNATPKPSK